MELPHIERIWLAHQNDEHFRMLVIGREETIVSAREYRDKNGFSFPIAADPDRAVYSLFAKESIPRTLVVSPDGRIVYSKAGFAKEDVDELNDTLRQQLAGVK
jgi:peroxiredoxin